MVKEEKETNVLLLKTVSVFSLIFQDWGQMNAVAAYAISLPICNVHTCVSFLCVGVPNIKYVGSSHEIYTYCVHI